VPETSETPEIKVTTMDNQLSLEEMSEALPDTATIMTRVGECWWHLIYAARGGNWDLADYYLRRVVKLENTLVTLRPKHTDRMARFQQQAVPPVREAMEARDLAALEAAYSAATEMANELHGESGYDYIRWELPPEPPKGGLSLGSVAPLVGRASGNGQPRHD
jgi:hypothetical protein